MKRTALVLSVILMFAVSCKKTVDSEKKSWEYNLKKITKLSYEYPSFKTILAGQQSKAEAVMKESESISDEKAKIKKMSEANSLLKVAFIRNLEKITSTKESITSKSVKVRGMSMPYEKRRGADQAVFAGERAITDADIKLKNSVTNTGEADALSSLVLTTLRSAESNLTSIISEVEALKAAEKKKEQQVQAAKAKVEKEKAEAAKPIKCEYCGTINPANSTTCKSCGAPLKKK